MPKTKFKLGQKVWHINNGYIECSTIRSLFYSSMDTVYLSFANPDFDYQTQLYSNKNKHVFADDTVYPTREALMKALKEQEVYEDD